MSEPLEKGLSQEQNYSKTVMSSVNVYTNVREPGTGGTNFAAFHHGVSLTGKAEMNQSP